MNLNAQHYTLLPPPKTVTFAVEDFFSFKARWSISFQVGLILPIFGPIGKRLNLVEP
jgi:hypothetical protein